MLDFFANYKTTPIHSQARTHAHNAFIAKIETKIEVVVVASFHTHSIYKMNGRGNFTFSASSAFHLVLSKLHSPLRCAAAKCNATSEFSILLCVSHKTFAE